MTYVIKRSGKKQAFSASKIKNAISNTARDAGVSKAKRDEIAKEIAGAVAEKYKKRKLVKAIEIRSAVLTRLARKSKAAVASWKRSEKKKRMKK